MKSILFIILAAVGMTSCQSPVNVRIPGNGKAMIVMGGNCFADPGDTIHVEYNVYSDSWQHDVSGDSETIAIVE